MSDSIQGDSEQPRPHRSRIAVDVGGTTLKGAVFADDGRVLHRETSPTFDSRSDAYQNLVALIDKLLHSARVAGIPPLGVGLAVPGVVDSSRGEVTFAANLGWAQLPLAERLTRRTGLPVRLDHDGRAGAIAERALLPRTSPAFDNFIFLPIGTGVAAAVTTNGVLVEGAIGAAGEFGHMPVMSCAEMCACGQRGCIEAYASASTVLRRYQARGGSLAATTPELVAQIGVDPLAATVWRDLIEALAIGVSSLIAVLDPAEVVIGGGLSAAGDTLLKPLRAQVESKLGWRATPTISTSRLGRHASLLGAAIMADTSSPGIGFTTTAAAHLRQLHAADTPVLANASGLNQ